MGGKGLGCCSLALDPQGNGMKRHTFENARKALDRNTVAPCRAGAGYDKGKSRRAGVEIVKGLGIGGLGLWMIDALKEKPGRRRRPLGPWPGPLLVDRLDDDTVIDGADELLREGRAHEHRRHPRHPGLAAGGRKLGGKGDIGHRRPVCCDAQDLARPDRQRKSNVF